MSKRWLSVSIIMAAVVVLLVFSKAYVIRGSAGGVLFWNDSEALLFIGGGNTGAKMSYLRYGLDPFVTSLGNVRQPNDERCLNVAVIRVTDENVEYYDTDVPCISDYRLFESQIYAASGPKLWKWSGSRFQPPTPEEIRLFESSKSDTQVDSRHPWGFDTVEGWSMRDLRQTPAEHRLTLNGHPVAILFHGATWPPKPLSVELIRAGQAAQTIWSFDEEPRRVSRVEYTRLFSSEH